MTISPLRCLSYNIWKNEGDFERRIDAIEALLRAHQPDIVALQECFASPGFDIDTAARLAAGSGYWLTRYPARAKLRRHAGGWYESRSDMALLTRMRPEAIATIALPTDQRDGERGLLWVDLKLGVALTRVGCTHLTHLRDAAAEAIRFRQANALMAALGTTANAMILMGDLNAPSDAQALQPIMASVDLCPQARDLARSSRTCVDHVLLFRRPEGPRLLSRSLLAVPDPDRPQTNLSDHPAVLAEIALS